MVFEGGSMLKKLWAQLSKRRQRQFWFLLVLMTISSVVEVISIGAVIPFLGVITSPEQVYQYQLMQPIIEILDLNKPKQLIFPVTVIFIIMVLISSIIRLSLLYVMTRLSFAISADLSIDIYRKTLHQSYLTHIARNSSEVINSVVTKTSAVTHQVIIPTLVLISSTILIMGIMIAFLAIDPTISIAIIAGFGSLYGVLIHYTRASLKENSECIAEKSTIMIKSLQEGLGGIRDVLINKSQKFYCNLYRNADLPLRRATGNNILISSSPRYFMEAIGTIFIAIFAYVLIENDVGLVESIPLLGSIALAAQRLLPALQQAYGSLSQIRGVKASFKDVMELLEYQVDDQRNLPLVSFKKEILINNAGFRYTKDTPWIFRNINLRIGRGENIGFIGETGSGKSTLIDVIMGLLPLTEGELIIDGLVMGDKGRMSWQDHIAHVPQEIYLSDGTVEENIAFGVLKESINHKKVEQAAKQAHISELVEGWKDQYKAVVGECGIKISGGQKQRVGLARAFYKKTDVLILDEATSALDSVTEKKVINSIRSFDKNMTVLVIAHRITTLKDCDRIIQISKNGKIHSKLYENLINK